MNLVSLPNLHEAKVNFESKLAEAIVEHIKLVETEEVQLRKDIRERNLNSATVSFGIYNRRAGNLLGLYEVSQSIFGNDHTNEIKKLRQMEMALAFKIANFSNDYILKS